MPPNPVTALRLALYRNGYRPVPVSDPNILYSTAGKAPFFKDWANVCTTADESIISGWEIKPRNHSNTGLLTGHVVGVDLDLPVQELAEQIGHLADAMLGTTPLHRIGKAPKSLRCYRTEVPMPKAETAELILPDRTKVQVEVLGDGQQFVAFGTHPLTERPYGWPQLSPLDVPLADLPIVDGPSLRRFLVATEAILRAAGGRTQKEIDAVEKAQAEAAAPPPEPEPGHQKRQSGSSNFFVEVNKRALANIGPWFCAVFPKAEEQTGGGLTHGCWRVSSADLGRNLEEDISMHPADGGHDFGTRQSCSPIDVVMEWAGAATAKDAAFFICEKLGIDPVDCGWKEPKSKKERPKAAGRKSTGLPLITVLAGELHTMTTAAEDAILQAGVPGACRSTSAATTWCAR